MMSCMCTSRPGTELAAAPTCCPLLLCCCLVARSCCFERLWPKPWLAAGCRFRGLGLFLGGATAAAEGPAAALLSCLHSGSYQSSTILEDLLHLIVPPEQQSLLYTYSICSHRIEIQRMSSAPEGCMQTSQNAPLPVGLCKFCLQLCPLLLPALSFIAQRGNLCLRRLHLLVPVPVPPQHLVHLVHRVRASRSTQIWLPCHPRDCLKKVTPKHWLGVHSEVTLTVIVINIPLTL